MRFQRAVQALTFALFLTLLGLAGYRAALTLPVDFLLRLDPLIAAGTMLTVRQVLWALFPGIGVILITVILGRIFCGYVCPMGTTIDAGRLPVARRTRARENSAESTNARRYWKYVFLVVVFAACLGGVSLVHLGSPLSLTTRLYGIVVHPLLTLLGETGLFWFGDIFSDVGLDSLAYAQVRTRVFATNALVCGLFLGVFALTVIEPRFWCRHLCPCGALLGLVARRPVIRRHVDDSCTRCGRCVQSCPMGAISENPGNTVHSECVVCLQCVRVCPESAVSFQVMPQDGGMSPERTDPGRRGFVLAGTLGLLTVGLFRTGPSQPTNGGGKGTLRSSELIRPPGSLPEAPFLDRCVRCGECMKACPTNTIQPVWFAAGGDGVFSPVLRPRLAPCAVNCNVCGHVCPTGAIRALPLTEKNHAKIGTAYIIPHHCLVWEQDRKCLVCDEVCPYNAIVFRPELGRRNAVPIILENRCIGCGWCEARCPVNGAAAIRVHVAGEVRLASGSYIGAARRFGLTFRKELDSKEHLGTGTFETGPAGPPPEGRDTGAQSDESELPPGFITK